ncbi:MAG: sensor histidine kinase [bacterium]|nr:sensor histidine kinase [bacterium]
MLESCFAVPGGPSPALSTVAQVLACPPLRDALIRGALVGILGLAGLFNLILLIANPRNISHLIFSAIGLVAAFALLLPYLADDRDRGFAEFQIFRVLLPILLFWFVYVLFPALRRKRKIINTSTSTSGENDLGGALQRLYALAVAGGQWVSTPAAIGIALATLALAGGRDANQWPPWIAPYAAACALFTIACTAVILLTASVQRQQGALVASTGFAIFAAGALADFFADSFGDSFAKAFGSSTTLATGLSAASPVLEPQIAGVLGFVLSMVILMGPNRYQMHRQLRASRNVLREANRKLRHLDTVKNRYITGSAREMQAPLQGMLEQCLRLIEDPAYRLGRSQLAALSGVMDMARRMIQRNERAAVLFQETEIRAREFDALNFFEMLIVVLEEQLKPLSFRLVNTIPDADAVRIFADPTLIEAAFIELAENARSHGVARRIEIRIAPGRRDPRRVRLAFYESPRRASPERLQELSEEFQQAGDSERQPGIGLGLSLVRRIAENHGSSLAIERPAGEDGVEFSFSAPRAGATGMRPPEVEWGLKHLRFLIRHDRRDQAADEARQLARRFPESRSEALQLLEDADEDRGPELER